MTNFPNNWNSRAAGSPASPIVCIVNFPAEADSGGTEELTEVLAKFMEDLATAERASRPAEVAAVLLSETVEFIDFSPVHGLEMDFETDFEAPSDKGGGENIPRGINEALDLVEQRTRKYREEGISHFPPLVFFFTNGGMANLPSEELAQVRQRLEHEDEIRRTRFIAITLDESDLPDLHQLCPPGRPPVFLESTDLNVARFGLDSWKGCGCMKKRQESEDNNILELEPFDEYLNQ